MSRDESALLSSLFADVPEPERQRLVNLLNHAREDSGARLSPRAAPGGDGASDDRS